MANRTLFQTRRGAAAPAADTRNEAGGLAFSLEPKAALAQLAVTGCLNRTFYADAETQADTILGLAAQCDVRYVAAVALYARQRGLMKDLPALLCAHLAARSKTEPQALTMLQSIFPRVIDNGRMLRNFVQMIRSGALGRKSLGTALKRLIGQWLNSRDGDAVFRLNVGQEPSLADIIKLAHPRPADAAHRALYGYLLGREYDEGALPLLTRAFEAYKRERTAEPPRVPFEMLTALDLTPEQWKGLARNASWQQTRQLLNTFKRHKVLDDPEMVGVIAKKLRDPEAIRYARVFPFQLLTAYYVASDVPAQIREALQDAMDVALENVPELPGQVVVCPDISGSMDSPITGKRGTATTLVRCRDVAALISAALVRRNPSAQVVAFSDQAVPFTLNPRDSVMTNTERLAKLPSGGTNCAKPIEYLLDHGIAADLVILVSDNESWMDTAGITRHTLNYLRQTEETTGLMGAWTRYRQKNAQAKLVCMDLQPYATTQAIDRADIFNVAGFSDDVFRLLPTFAAEGLSPGAWVREIEALTV